MDISLGGNQTVANDTDLPEFHDNSAGVHALVVTGAGSP
jgi:hypothetical protein